MELTWLELAGKLALGLFPAMVVGLVLVDLARSRTSDRQTSAMTGLLLQYLGNVDPEPGESRADGARRKLLDEIVRELDRGGVPHAEREPFLEELRGAIHSEQRLSAADPARRELERRYLETRRWSLAERFREIVEDAPPHVIARLQSGISIAEDAASSSDPGE